jgi:hypothetical protein
MLSCSGEIVMNVNRPFLRIQQAILILSLTLLLCPACNFPQMTPSVEDSQTKDEIPITPTETAIPIDITSTLEKGCVPALPEISTAGETRATVIEPFDLLVSSGNKIYGLIRRPDPAQYPDLCFPAVVLVPGGINPGRMEAYGQTARALSEAGMVVVTFNAEGRVDSSPDDIRSEGAEDNNGFRHQDSLCELVLYTIQLPYVITENVGIKTQSFGIAMGAGCAGRHPEIPIKYLVDGEGPPNSFVTCHEPRALDEDPSNDKHEIVYGILNHYSTYRDPSTENQAFWEEREAERFIGSFRGRYLRLQAEWDHSQPPDNEAEIATFHLPPLWWRNKHTTDIVNLAVEGGVPWVRVNLPEQGNAVNATFDMDNPPVYLPGMLADKPWDVRAILEMARMP